MRLWRQVRCRVLLPSRQQHRHHTSPRASPPLNVAHQERSGVTPASLPLRERLLARLSCASFPSPNAALALLIEEFPLHDEPRVVQRLVEVVEGNACVLCPRLCLTLMKRCRGGEGWFDEASLLQRHGQECGGSGERAHLRPLERVLLTSLWGRLSLRAAPKQCADQQHDRGGWARFRREELPDMCATLLDFTATTVSSSSLAAVVVDPEPLLTHLTTDVVQPVLRAYFGAAARPHASQCCPADITTPSPSVVAALREARVWWELGLRAAPSLPAATAACVWARAWQSLADAAALAGSRSKEAPTPRQEGEAVGAHHHPHLLQELDAFLRRLPVLQRTDGDVTPGSPANSLLPLMVPIAKFALDREGRQGSTEAAAAVRILHRLLTEHAVAGGHGSQDEILDLLERHNLPVAASLQRSTHHERFDETLWMLQTSLLQWHLRHAPAQRGRQAECAAHARQALRTGLSFLAKCDARRSQDAPDEAEGCGDAPSQALLLRYMQCWQAWLPLMMARGAGAAPVEWLVAELTQMEFFHDDEDDEEKSAFSCYALARSSEKRRRGGEGNRSEEQQRLVAHFAKRHERLLTRSVSRCLADVAAPRVSPLLTLHSIAQLTLLLAAANDPARALRRRRASPSCDSSPLPPSSTSLETAWDDRTARCLHTLLLSAGLLRRLRRQCTGVFSRLRHSPSLHRVRSRVGGEESERRATGPAHRAPAPEGGDAGLFTIVPPSAQDARHAEEVARQEGMLEGTSVSARRRWQLRFLPCLLCVLARFGGGTGQLPLIVAASTSSSVCACAPGSVEPFWDDVSLLPLITSMRSDLYDLDREVREAYPRLVASALLEECEHRFRVSCRTLQEGIPVDDDTLTPTGRRAVPFFLSVFGAPVALGVSGSTENSCFTDFFLWQQSCCWAGAASSPSAGAREAEEEEVVREVTPSLVPFCAAPLEGASPDVLRPAMRRRQADYAHDLLLFGALCAFSDAVSQAATAATAPRRERELQGQGDGGECVMQVRHRTRLGLLPCATLRRERQLTSLGAWAGHTAGSAEESATRERGEGPALGLPWMSFTARELHLSQLWKCLHTLHLRFREALEEDVRMVVAGRQPDGSVRGRGTRLIAPLRSHRQNAQAYARHLHSCVLADFDKHGELEVSMLALAFIVPWARLCLSAPVCSSLHPGHEDDILSVAVAAPPLAAVTAAPCPNAQLNEMTGAMRALQMLLCVCPAAAFSVLTPEALMGLWRRAAAAASLAGPSSAERVSAAQLDFLASSYVLIQLGHRLEHIKREACEYVVTHLARELSDAVDALDGPQRTAPDSADELSAVFSPSGAGLPFDVLDALIAARRDDAHLSTRHPPPLPPPPLGTAVCPRLVEDADEQDDEHTFASASVAFAEIIDRSSSHDVYSLLSALREESSRDGEASALLPASPELAALVERMAAAL